MDEYCHEVKEGPHEPRDSAWTATLDSILQHIVGSIPQHEALLLTIWGMWELDETGSDESAGPGVNLDVIQQQLLKVVVASAGSRDIARFDPSVSC
jgi:hypothetical protein